MGIEVTPKPTKDEAIAAILRDPDAVHVNMLRGSIAKPSVEQIIHIYGADNLRAALSLAGD